MRLDFLSYNLIPQLTNKTGNYAKGKDKKKEYLH